MPLRRASPLNFRPVGCSDAVDGSNVFPGAMEKLVNLVPSQNTQSLFTCRPAAERMTAFPGFNTTGSKGFVSAMLIVGDIAYGMISTNLNAGKDEPFSYNLLTNTFNTVSGVLNANTPTSPNQTGAWTPPQMRVVGTRVLVTHPGFAGGAVKFGWFDISGFSSTTVTGTTHLSTTLDALSTNVLLIGWQPGMTIAGAGIPANTTIVSIAAGGLSVVLSNAATIAAAGVALTVAGGTAAAPLWGAGDTSVNPLPSVPVGVGQMNGRAYFLCGQSIPFSDSLLPCIITNATQVLRPANGLNCTAIGPLGLFNQVVGGIVQSLIVFQGVSGIQQITGDQATSNLSINANTVATGTFAPNTVIPTPLGLAFASPHGIRLVTLQGEVTAPIGDAGSGIAEPFIYAVEPSRMSAGSGTDVYRITTQNGKTTLEDYQDWWWDLTRKIWTGPHTFPASIICPWRDTYVMAPVGILASLWQSDAQPSLTSTFTENSVPLTCNYRTTLLPDNSQMEMNAIIESTIAISLPYQKQAVLTATDEEGAILDQTSIVSRQAPIALWGSVNWGQFLWNSGLSKFLQQLIPWTKPLVFKQAQFQVSFSAASGVQIGNLYLRYQILGYTVQQ